MLLKNVWSVVFFLSLSRVLLLPVRLMVLTLDFPYILVDYFDVVTHYRLA